MNKYIMLSIILGCCGAFVIGAFIGALFTSMFGFNWIVGALLGGAIITTAFLENIAYYH